jgi:predicted transcriptional regulator
MATVKTAISVEGELLRRAEQLARRLKVTRSGIFAAAMAEFVERRRNRELLQAINEAYADAPDAQEAKHVRAMRAQHRRLVRGR